MPYFPKSQIKPNLYTNGNEYSKTPPNSGAPQVSYVGYFYEISNGDKFTGKTPEDGFNERLYRFYSANPDVFEGPDPSIIIYYLDTLTVDSVIPKSIKTYANLRGDTTIQSRHIPTPLLSLPTPQDYITGTFTRYFAKKNNEPKFIEINKNQYDQFKSQDSSVAFDLYSVISLIWKIKGEREQVYNANKKNVEYTTNRIKWWGFPQYFKDNFTKYLK